MSQSTCKSCSVISTQDSERARKVHSGRVEVYRDTAEYPFILILLSQYPPVQLSSSCKRCGFTYSYFTIISRTMTFSQGAWKWGYNLMGLNTAMTQKQQAYMEDTYNYSYSMQCKCIVGSIFQQYIYCWGCAWSLLQMEALTVTSYDTKVQSLLVMREINEL